MAEYLAQLSETTLFQGIPKEDTAPMLACLGASSRTFSKGSAILRTGESSGTAGIVLSGQVQICRDSTGGNRNLFASVGPGGLFAEAYACARRPLPVSVWAETQSTILLIDMGKAASLCPSACPSHVKLIRNLLSVLAEKNIALNQKIDCISQRTLRDKLLTYLESQAIRTGSRFFSIPFDRQSLADYLCVDRSALSRTLGQLRQEEVLKTHKNHFTLLSPQ